MTPCVSVRPAQHSHFTLICSDMPCMNCSESAAAGLHGTGAIPLHAGQMSGACRVECMVVADTGGSSPQVGPLHASLLSSLLSASSHPASAVAQVFTGSTRGGVTQFQLDSEQNVEVYRCGST